MAFDNEEQQRTKGRMRFAHAAHVHRGEQECFCRRLTGSTLMLRCNEQFRNYAGGGNILYIAQHIMSEFNYF